MAAVPNPFRFLGGTSHDFSDLNLVSVIRTRLEESANRAILRFLGDQEGDETCVTYADLDLRARAIAAELQAAGGLGQRALVLHPPGIEYIVALLGCFYAGVVAVPAYPPRMNRSVNRLRDIALDAQARFGLTTEAALDRFDRQEESNSDLAALHWIATDKCSSDLATQWRPHTPRADDVALLQYTSGSTSAPKGVVLSHANFLHNINAMAALRGANIDDHFVSWLPPYHDMGLVGATLLPLCIGTTATLLSPTTFLQRPYRWLAAITRHGGTISGGPNFAFDLCCRRVSEAQRATLDLRTWRVAFSGAERVRAGTLERFAEMFASCGFRPAAFAPCYGLAEATLAVSFTPVNDLPTLARLDEHELGKGRAVDSQSTQRTRFLVGCGAPLADCELRVVDPQTRQLLPDNAVGELWVRTPSVALGYWRKPELTEAVFGARLAGSDESAGTRYLRTGDLGFMRDGSVFIAGRIKDLIVLRGVNHYPEDIEAAIEACHPRLRPGCGIAFSADLDGDERLVIVHEVDSLRDLTPAPLLEAVRNTVSEQLQLQVYDVVLVEPGSVPKTSSGKLQRNLCRELYQSDRLAIVERSGPPAEVSQETTELTSQVAALMATILSVDRMGVDEDFFWLGGHSLLATQLISRVREIFSVDISLRAAFESPTPRALAARIAAAPRQVSQGPVVRANREAPLSLSFSQERMWLLHQLDPQSAAYNVAGAGVIDGPLDVSILHASLNEAVQLHEVLRTNYFSVAGHPVVRIVPSVTLDLEIVDLTGYQDPEAKAREWSSDFAARPFNVSKDLLIRAVLYGTAPQTHVLCVSMHHLVTDAWSMGIFTADVLKSYVDRATGGHSGRTQSDLTYIDYAHWQRSYFSDDRLAPEIAHWTKLLAGAEAIELPTDRPRAARRSAAGAIEPLTISPELFASLRSFAAAEGATLFMVMLAAFEVLLNRYTNRADLVVGVPVANRNWLASEKVMGTLVNTLALRTQFDPADSFRDLLQKVREVTLDAYSHQDLPFERLISALHVERRPGESPLIRVMFDFQNAPTPGSAWGSLQMRPMHITRHASQFDLSLLIMDTDLGRIASVEYSTELFEGGTIRRLLSHYLSILECIALNPQAVVARIALLGTAERQQVLALGNQPCELDRSGGGVLPAFFGNSAGAPAVVDDRGSLNYQELELAVSRLAVRLQAAGAGPGERVAVALDRNRYVVIALLAVLKSGAAYVPVDARHPPDRIAMILQDADVRVVLTESAFEEKLNAPASAEVLRLDALDGEIPTGGPARESAAGEAAYLIFTSGSTGRPKGVEVSRGALANFLRSMAHTPGITRSDRLLAVTTVAFDIAGLELLLPLAVGANVYVTPYDVAIDARRLLDLMSAYQPTIMQATPATWRMLIDAGWNGDPQLKILCGGEALPLELARKLQSRCASLWNMYGPTETTIWSTVHRVQNDDSAAVSIGSPIDATHIYILDDNGELVPQGVSGEIYIGGAGVANGYFRNPQLTRQRFLADPFSPVVGARMYRTGDAGRWRANGTLEYLGRLDHQIKLRGFRIEPAEIELAIKATGRVRDAIVVAREVSGGDVRLIAYCVVAAAELHEPQLSPVLSEALSRQLPSYMVPSAFVPLTEFPHTPNGKIDRKALLLSSPWPLPQVESAADADTYVAPRDEIETTLQKLWQDVLGVPRVGIRDNFFRLGGHSLLATRLFAGIERAFGVPLQLALLFERSTIEYLAECIRAAAAPPVAQPVAPRKFSILVPMQMQGSRPPLFCVHGAGGQVLNFWALSQHLGKDQPFYALQAPGVDGKENPYANIEAMARAYLEELRAQQPQGPYYLSGYCGGGWIAFEMANRLRRAGEAVAMLALLDAYGPNTPPDPRVERWLQGAIRQGPGYVAKKAKARLRRDYETVSRVVRIKHALKSNGVIPHDLRDVWMTQAFLKAAAEYRPAPYDGSVTLLLAQDVVAPPGVAECQFGWAGLVPAGLQVHRVPGTHFTLTQEPNVGDLAAKLANCIDAARAASNGR
jgi:amino acid adenylation domain-containing protein